MPFTLVVVPRLPDFSLDVAQIVKMVEQEKPKCIFWHLRTIQMAGMSLTLRWGIISLFVVHIAWLYMINSILFVSVINDEDLLKMLDLPVLVVLDEAYVEFSSLQSRMTWVKKHDNLIVLRTFSKRAGVWFVFCRFGVYRKLIRWKNQKEVVFFTSYQWYRFSWASCGLWSVSSQHYWVLMARQAAL